MTTKPARRRSAGDRSRLASPEPEPAELARHLLTVRDQERRRLARELHDTTAQNLSALGMHLTSLARKALPARLVAGLERALALVKQCSEELDHVASELHPPLLDPCGLASALRWYVGVFERRAEIAVDLSVAPGLGRFPADLETTVFRIVEECLTNVHRHSGSATATVRIDGDAHAVTVVVADQGHGIPEENDPRGVGIASMRERALTLGGTLEVLSTPSGTTVRATLPTGLPR